MPAPDGVFASPSHPQSSIRAMTGPSSINAARGRACQGRRVARVRGGPGKHKTAPSPSLSLALSPHSVLEVLSCQPERMT